MDYFLSVSANMGLIAFVALSAYLLLIVGQISFGQQGFFAIGAYTAAVSTTVWQLPLVTAIGLGALGAGIAGTLLGLPTLRLRGLYFAIGTLAFGEMVRTLLNVFRYQVEIDGELIGPAGSEGFRNIRYLFEHDVSQLEFAGLIYGLLGAVVALLIFLEHTRLGSIFRMLGEDDLATSMQGIDVNAYRLLAVTLSGVIAGVGGALFAHYTTYLEPRNFGIMLGVHSLAYGLIGGLGTAFGPLLGVGIDIGLLESLRWFSSYRMIIFGGLVAVLLIFRNRGLLDEAFVHRLRLTRRAGAAGSGLQTWTEAPDETIERNGVPLLAVEGLSKSFGGNRVLTELSFEVPAGLAVGVIGPNGGGKTTLFNILTGVIPPSAGQVWFRGQEITGRPTHRIIRLGLARTFQNLRLFNRMTVFENVWSAQHRLPDMPAWRLVAHDRKGERSRREIVHHLLELTGLADQSNVLAQNLPLGVLRKLELARALARDPLLLLLDEPMGGMVPQEVDEVTGLLERIIASGKTLLLIEHKIDTVMELCKHIVVLNFGVKICEGSPDQVRADPAVIEAYMGSEANGAAESTEP